MARRLTWQPGTPSGPSKSVYYSTATWPREENGLTKFTLCGYSVGGEKSYALWQDGEHKGSGTKIEMADLAETLI